MNISNLGQTSGDFPISRQNLGRSGNSEIPDRLGFPRHMKTRLYFACTISFATGFGTGLGCKLHGKLPCTMVFLVYTLFFFIRSNFGTKAERSYIFLRFEAENVLKMFLNYIVYTTCISLNHRTRPGTLSRCIAC